MKTSVLLFLLCAGCNQDPDAPPPDLAMSQMDAAMCAATCGNCAADELCVAPNALLSDFEATCLKKCNVTSDCPTTMRCALFFGEPQKGPFCTSDSSPQGCHTAEPGWHCDLAESYCRDANTLAMAFTSASNLTCGFEMISCPNGCESVDGGAPSFGHCR